MEQLLKGMQMKLVKAICVLLLVVSAAQFKAQSGTGAQVYAKSHDSVFLIYLNDSEGQSVALGSGFLVAPHRIVTNAHVADAGKPVISIGAVRIPAKIVRVDEEHDLALLQIDVDIAADPLKLSTTKFVVGEDIFAIGNPKGLEGTFSQGVISADRTGEKPSWIQISAPISHGSSGGPILDSKGEVVGVAVAGRDDGQNLNFAVPVKYVAALLLAPSSKTPDTSSETPKSALEKAIRLSQEVAKEEPSDNPSSPWQTKIAEIESLLKIAVNSNDPRDLVRLVQVFDYNENAISIQAAEKAFQVEQSTATATAMVDVLLEEATLSNEKESSDKNKEIFARAASIGEPIILNNKAPSAAILGRMGIIRLGQGQTSEAIDLLQRSLSAPDDEWALKKSLVLEELVDCSAAIKDVPQRHKWFEQLVQTGDASASDLSSEAERLIAEGNAKGATELYEKAAPLSQTGGEWCWAAIGRGRLDSLDETLSDGRECLSRQDQLQKSSKAFRDADFAQVHVYMSRVLNFRGVYEESLSHAREATRLDPTNVDAFQDVGQALYALGRYQESVAAEKEALRLSDGNFAFAHYTLGNAYFELKNWELAQHEFEIASRQNPKDDESPYNVALSLQRQGFTKDAVQWYEEVLQRNPNRKDRDEIRKRIKELKK